MEYIVVFLKVITGMSILNVWLLRKNRTTPYRGGNSESLFDEISFYGLPDWSFPLIGTLKVMLALLLLVSVWMTQLSVFISLGLGLFMLGAFLLHLKVNDSFKKSLPSLSLFISCIIVFFYSA